MQSSNTLFKTIKLPALVTGLLLLIPLIAMQFTAEANWTPFDFVIAGIVLFATGLTYSLITKISENVAYHVAVGFALFTGLFLIWVNLAVGIIGSENNPANIMYFGVIAAGVIGALLAHFQPLGMSLTMFAMAFTQTLITANALIAGMQQSSVSSVTEILGVNGLFFFLFIVSALLFRYAAQEETEANSDESMTS